MTASQWGVVVCLKRALVLPAAIGMLCSVSACSGGADYVDHGFEFDAQTDTPGIQILEYKYGDGAFVGTQNPPYLLKEGRSLQRTNVWGHMRRPDTLYVKWRIADEDRTLEDTVDLRKRLPRNLTGSKVYFMVQGTQLEVYLISMGPRKSDSQGVGPKKFRHLEVTKIYPDQN